MLVCPLAFALALSFGFGSVVCGEGLAIIIAVGKDYHRFQCAGNNIIAQELLYRYLAIVGIVLVVLVQRIFNAKTFCDDILYLNILVQLHEVNAF